MENDDVSLGGYMTVHVPIVPKSLRLAMLVYVVVWGVLTPIISVTLHAHQSYSYIYEWVLASVVMLIPVLIVQRKSFAGLPMDWANPVFIITLFNLLWDIFSSPVTMISPFLVLQIPVHMEFFHPLLPGWSEEKFSSVRVFGQTLNLVAVLFFLIGMQFSRNKLEVVTTRENIRVRTLYLFIISALVVAIVFLQMRGGLLAHIAGMSRGRFREFAGLGPVLAYTQVGLVALLIVFCHKILNRKTLLGILPLLLIICALPFIISGSRANIFVSFFIFSYAYILISGRVPWRTLVVTGAAGVLTLGLLGEIRNIGRSTDGVFDTSALSVENSFRGLLDSSLEETSRRLSNDSFLPTIALGPSQYGYLYGRTYLNSIAWFVPRAIWPEKPRGIGSHVTALIYGRHTGEISDYQGGGIPPGGVGEAYWNGGLLLVVFVFFVYGWLLGALAHVYKNSPRGVLFLTPLYVLVMIMFRDPTTNVITPVIQVSFLAIGLLVLSLGRPSLKRRSS